MARYSIAYGEESSSFSICYLPRRRVAIHVMPDGSVRVDAPEDSDPLEVKRAVRRRARWIWRQLLAHRERHRHVLLREYVSGETHFYLGRRHMLKVHTVQAGAARVRLWRGRLEVAAMRPEADAVRDLLETWYRERAHDVFARVLADFAERAKVSPPPPWRLRSMRTQW